MDGTATVRDVMDRAFVGVSESDTVTETAELLLSEGADGAVVLRGDEPVGVVTERDALQGLVGEAADQSVREVMTEEVPTVRPDETISDAATEMTSLSTQRVIVTDGSRPVGLLSEHDLITASPFPPKPDVTEEPESAVVGHHDDRAEMSAPADQGYEDQSICEACGALARDLSQFNGQLLCADCRDI